MSFKSLFSGFDKPKELDMFIAFRSIQLLLESGATLPQALQEISSTQRNHMLGKGLANISRSLTIGMSAGAAFRREKIFPLTLCAIVDIGDKSGNLSRAFASLASMMYLQHNLYNKIKGTLLVPKISAVLMFFLILAYVEFAIPEYLEMYKENDMEIPWLITFVSDGVHNIFEYWYITFGILYGIYWNIKQFCIKNVMLIDRWKLKMPIYRDLHFNLIQHQFASTLQLMLSSGLTIPTALEEASKAVDNSLMRQAIQKVNKDVLTGYDLARSMRKYNYDNVFDEILISSIKAGEGANQLARVLSENCDFYYKSLNDLIEPTGTKITFIVMIPMGAIIIGMFVFTLLPMLNYISHVS